MAERAHDGSVEQVGEFELSVDCAEPSPEASERWPRRVEALTAWLLAAWQRERKEGSDD